MVSPAAIDFSFFFTLEGQGDWVALLFLWVQKGVVKKRRSKSQDFLLLGNLDSFLCQIAKITILAEFWVQQTQRHKNCVFAVLKIWKIF